MSSQDARFLSPDAQEVLRARAMVALRGGMKPARAARTFGVSRSSVWNWRQRVALGNITSLRSKKRGRPKGTQLAPHQAATTVRLITDRCPDQLKLPFALWTREAVQQRLLRLRRRKVLLIVDRHPVHLSAVVKGWLARHADRLEVFFLPGYSPDLNPDEFLNQDVKSNALGRQRPATRTEMITGVRSYLRSTQRQPQIVRNYFHAKSVRYAAR